jgi:hypothetical protein
MGPGSSRRRIAALALGLLLVLRAGWLAAAEPMPLRPDLQVPLLLKILTYDRHFESKASRELAIGIVYSPEDPASLPAADQIFTTLYKFRDKTVKAKPIRYYLLEYTSPEKLERSIADRGISVLYVAPGNGPNLEALLKVSQARGVTTTTGVPEYVRRGVSVGIGLADDRPQILINQTSARAEGSEFDASLLRIATVLK